MHKLLLISYLLIHMTSAFANEWLNVKAEVGSGYSNNVYQDDLNKKSDFFVWLQTQAKYSLTDSKLIAKINLSLYSTENLSNSATYSLTRKSELNYERLGLTLGIGGFSYFKSAVASTDESYNHFYVNAYLTKNILSRNHFELDFEPGIKVSSYPQLSGRNDLTIFARLDGLWQFGADIDINPYFELGFLYSNQSYYVKNYIDFGAVWNQQLDERYKFNVDLYTRSSFYPNRKVSDILFLPNRKGRSTSVNINSIESIGLTQIAAAIIRTDSVRELSLGLNYATQNSISQLEYYSELQLLASALWIF